jgi:hypothetical protein
LNDEEMKDNVQKNRVAADPSQWSESSKRSYSFVARPTFYEDIPYNCWRCGKASVFGAKDQKEAFEVKKAYIWQRRMLCQECWRQEQEIASDLRQCQTRWDGDKKEAASDNDFLKNWLRLLELHPEYGARKNSAAINMLRKLLNVSN